MQGTILATAGGPAGGLEAVAVLLALLAISVIVPVVDRLSQSPKAGRLDAMLDRALGGQNEGDR